MTPRWRAEPSWTGVWTLPGPLSRPLTGRQRLALVAASLAGAGPRRLARELEAAGSVEGLLRRIPRAPPLPRAEAVLRGTGARAVVPSDPEYPALLRASPAPPLLLYVRGRPLDALGPMVAVVGSRHCTRGGARFAARLGGAFAAAGFTVVSGLARGIDAAAHRGALEEGRTLAVLGTGIDVVYPPEHRELAAAVAEAGALVTEFPPGAGPRPWHFPARNRLVAWSALAVVVVEAGERSGALITAGFAADEGREVFACTVAPESPSGAGVRALLREGACLVVDPDDAVQELVDLARAQGYELQARAAAGGVPLELTGEAAVVFEAVLEATTVDEVAAATGLGAGRVSALLASLELEGLVERQGAGWSRTGARVTTPARGRAPGGAG